MQISNTGSKIADKLLLILVAFVFVAYFSLGMVGLESQYVSGRRIELISMALCFPVISFIGAKLFFRVCWSDAASLASGAIWHSLIAIGVFYGTRDVLGWHWSMAILLALPASVFMLGTVWHRANNSTPAALAARQDATCIEVGRTYDGKIDKLFKSGMAVSIAPGVIGLLHIWQITGNLKKRVSNALRVGDTIKVKVLDIDPQGRVRLTMENLGTDGQISSPVT